MGFIVTESEIDARIAALDDERRIGVRALLLSEKAAARAKLKSESVARAQERELAVLESESEKARLALLDQGIESEWIFNASLSDIGHYSKEEGVGGADFQGEDKVRLYLTVEGLYFITLDFGSSSESTHQVRQFERVLNLGRADHIIVNDGQINFFVHASLGAKLNGLLSGVIGTSDVMDVVSFG